MKESSKLSLQCTFVVAIGIVASFFGYFFPGSQFLGGFLIAISLFFLVAGWYFFRGYYPEGHPLLLFFIGYLYASLLMTFTFVISEWPMAKMMITVAPIWSIALYVTIFIIRKKISKTNFIQFLIEAVFLLILTILFLFRMIR
jgi:hypothetical protein